MRHPSILGRRTTVSSESSALRTANRRRLLAYFHGAPCLGSIRLYVHGQTFAKRLHDNQLPVETTQGSELARLMNEIILGEESDVRPDGSASSHLELYLEAMEEVGASTTPIKRFLQALDAGRTWQGSLQNCGAPKAGTQFAQETLKAVENESLAFIVGAFTFGRENLLPDLFLQFVRHLDQSHPGKFLDLVYYFQRHIEVDGEEHGPLAIKMLEKTVEAGQGTAVDAFEGAQAELVKRCSLWDSILEVIQVPAIAAS